MFNPTKGNNPGKDMYKKLHNEDKSLNKVVFIMLSFFLLIAMVFPSAETVYADMGPKPSITIVINNPPDEEYYVAFLSPTGTGPWQIITESNVDDLSEWGWVNQDESIVKEYLKYEDPEGYGLLGFIGYFSGDEGPEDDNELTFSYYAPKEFKLAVYVPSDGRIMVSEAMTRKAFNSYYSVSFTDNNGFTIKEEPYFTLNVLSFIFRAVSTIIIEVLLGLLFKYRKKPEIITIILVNLITQILLNLIMAFSEYVAGELVWFFIFPLIEIVIAIVEMVVYLIKFKEHKKGKTVLYALLANLVTFFAGLFIAVSVIAY